MKVTIDNKLGLKIQRLLKSQNKTAEKLASEIGMNRSYLYKIASGDRYPSLHALAKISKGLDVKIQDLFQD